MLAVFGIGFTELLVIAAILGMFVFGAIITVVVVMAAASGSKRE